MTSDPLPAPEAIPMPTQEPLPKSGRPYPYPTPDVQFIKVYPQHQKDIGTRTRWLER